MFTLFRLLIQALLLDSFSHELVYLCTNDVIAVDDEIYGDKHFAWQNFCPMISHTHPSTHHNSIENDECFSQESTVKIRYMKSAWKRSPELNKMQADTHTHSTSKEHSQTETQWRNHSLNTQSDLLLYFFLLHYTLAILAKPKETEPKEESVRERERGKRCAKRETEKEQKSSSHVILILCFHFPLKTCIILLSSLYVLRALDNSTLWFRIFFLLLFVRSRSLKEKTLSCNRIKQK